MKRKFWELMNSAAFEPVMFCSAEGDGDGEGDANGGGDNNGGTGGDNGDGKGADANGKSGGDAGSKLAGKGLFGQRKDGGDNGQGNGDGGNDADTGTEPDGRPKGLAEKFWDGKAKAIKTDALSKAYADLEKAHGELKRSKGPGGGEVPETADGYFADGVKLPDEVQNLTIGADDPGLKSWAEVCKEEGIGKDLATRLMSKMFVKMDEFAPAPIDPEQEMKALGKNGPSLVDGLFVWCEGLERAGEFSEDDIGVIEHMMMTASGARLLAKFRNMSGEKPIPVDPGGNVRGMSLDQLDAKYKEAVKNKDYAEQERLDGLRNQINPDGQQPGISGRSGGYSI